MCSKYPRRSPHFFGLVNVGNFGGNNKYRPIQSPIFTPPLWYLIVELNWAKKDHYRQVFSITCIKLLSFPSAFLFSPALSSSMRYTPISISLSMYPYHYGTLGPRISQTRCKCAAYFPSFNPTDLPSYLFATTFFFFIKLVCISSFDDVRRIRVLRLSNRDLALREIIIDVRRSQEHIAKNMSVVDGRHHT